MANPKITVYGAMWCLDCRRTRRFLDQHQIEYEWINVDQNKQAKEYVLKVNRGMCSIPTIVFPDGSIMVEPSTLKLAQKLEIPIN